MGISPGRLNKRVEIQAATKAPDGAGGTTKAWATFATVWAEVLPLNGGEAFRQGMQNSTQLYRVTIRKRSDVTPANRLMLGSLPLNIRTCADPDGLRESLLMTVESGAAEP